MTRKPGSSEPPVWSQVLRALREARGVSQEGWAAQLGVGRRTVQRWEQGATVPDPMAEAALLAWSDERALYRRYDQGPLAGITLTASWLRDLLAEARLGIDQSRGAAALLPPSPSSIALRMGNLPVALPNLVGRERELAAVAEQLPTARLLTLTGPGGVGKTRLALAVAGEAQHRFVDGAAFVDLTAITNPDLLSAAILQALGVPETPSRSPDDLLRDVLRRRSLLLILDNFEHVVAAASEVARLLVACPDVRVLATSREVLRVAGEREFQVEPLALPDAADTSVDAIARAPAVQLFVDCARAHRASFDLDTTNAATVAAICARVDALPLALELAAARTAVLPLWVLLERLASRLNLLTSGPRDAAARQQTLRAAIAWSYNLLTPHEQRLFRRLAVCVGGCTHELAEALVDGPGDLGVEVLDELGSLANKSLLRRRVGVSGVPCFSMLETIREFAWGELTISGEADTVQRRHAAAMVALAEAAEPHQRTGARSHWDPQLADERANIRAALTWAVDHDEAQTGLRILGALWLWYFRHSVSEGRKWAAHLLALPSAGDRTPQRAKTLLGAAALAWTQEDWPVMEAMLDESIAIWRELPDTENRAFALTWAPFVHTWDLDRRRTLGEEGLSLFRELDHTAGIAWSLNAIGTVGTNEADNEVTWARAEECLALCRRLDDPWLLALALGSIAYLAGREGDLATAQAHTEEVLPLMRTVGDTYNLAGVLEGLATLMQQQGQHGEAVVTLLAESLELAGVVGTSAGVAGAALGLAIEAWVQGDAWRAARLLGMADGALDPVGRSMWPSYTARAEHLERSLRDELGGAFATADAEGRALSLDDAVALALEQPQVVDGTSPDRR